MATLLLIDDDPDLLRDRVSHVLPAPVHRIEIAQTGAEGLARVAAACSDVILLDLRLPDQSGLDRAAGGDCHHRDPDVPRRIAMAEVAGAIAGKRLTYETKTGKVLEYSPEPLVGGVRQAEAGGVRPIQLNSAGFLSAKELAARSQEETERRHKAWLAASAAWRRDPSLKVYYQFKAEQSWDRTLRDQAGQPPHDGAIVGCSWATGRWPGKQALEFKQVSDRVRRAPEGSKAVRQHSYLPPFVPDNWDIEIVGQRLTVRRERRGSSLQLRLDPAGAAIFLGFTSSHAGGIADDGLGSLRFSRPNSFPAPHSECGAFCPVTESLPNSASKAMTLPRAIATTSCIQRQKASAVSGTLG
jgi:CheY-like chemotaxis protein